MRFEARGDGGTYEVMINTLNGRWSRSFTAGPGWTTIEAPFAELKRAPGRGASTAAWNGKDLVEVEVSGARDGGRKLWLEVDNVTFY